MKLARSRFSTGMIRHLSMMGLVVGLGLVQVHRAVVSAGCPDVETLRSQGIEFYRYLPQWSPAREDIQFVYSSGILAEHDGDAAVVHAALDSLASLLLVDRHNIYGADVSDIALIYNMVRVTDEFPYPYGDPYYETHGGGNMLLAGRLPENMNHLDIVITTPEEGKVLSSSHCGPRNPHYGEYGMVKGFPADDGEPGRSSANGLVFREIPLSETSPSYQTLLHELGHVFDFTDGVDQRGMHFEAKAEFTRAIVAYPADEGSWGRHEIPYHGTYVLTRKRSAQAIKDDLGRSLRWNGQLWLAYLAEHFHNGTPTDIFDDLLHEYLTVPYPGETAVDLHMSGLAKRLEDAKYDDGTRYPYFQRDGVPLNGENRAERLFHNFSVALAVNAPQFGNGEFGFPLHYQPTKHSPLFQDIGGSPNRAGIPPEFTITSEDYGVDREIVSPVEFDDGSKLPLRMYSWCMELLVFHLEEHAAAGGTREVAVRVIGDSLLPEDSDPPFSAEAPFHHSLSASLILMNDLDGREFWESSDKVVRIDSLEIESSDAGPSLEFVIPAGSGIRTAILAMTLAEKGMQRRVLKDRQSAPWKYHVEYTLRDSTP